MAKLSKRAIRILTDCKDATVEKPSLKYKLFGEAEPYAHRGLLDSRGYNPSYDWSSGGYYITPAGRQALSENSDDH